MFMKTGNNDMDTMPSCRRLCITLEIDENKLFAETYRDRLVKHILSILLLTANFRFCCVNLLIRRVCRKV